MTRSYQNSRFNRLKDRNAEIMTPERWQRVDEIFQAAIQLNLADRATFLDNSCAGDQDLRQEVETLIFADEQGLSLIDTPAFETAARLLTSAKPELTEGQHIGRYEIVGAIGKGGMGEVYLAKDKLLNRRIALKLLPAEFTRDKDRVRRFQQEAQAASALNHPNILTIYELGQVDEQQFIATEFVDGETLRQRMKRGGLSLGEALEIASQIAGALAVAHKAGIIHRDIKPDNIMLRHDGYVKVLDFGLAKLTEQQEPSVGARPGENPDISSGLIMGTVRYMSPEQARGLPVDARSDIFSFGVVFYEMLTGDAPFKGEATGDLIKSILKDEPRPLAEYIADAPEDLQRIISKTLRKDKAKRYQTVDDLLVDLKTPRWVAELGPSSQSTQWQIAGRAVSTQDLGIATSSIQYAVSQIREHKPIAAVALVSLIILFGGVGYSLKKWISKRGSSAKELKTTILTTTGNVLDAAISPDGKYIAYWINRTGGAGPNRLCVRELDSNEEKEIIVGDRPLRDLVFTPDDKYLYYLVPESVPSSYTASRSLYRIPVPGGAAEKLIDRLGVVFALSPDGKRVAAIRQDESAGLGTLVIANADGTDERSIITRKPPNRFATNYDQKPSWAPDGNRIVYVAQDANAGYARVFEFNLETNTERPLTFQKWEHVIKDVAWLPDASGILINASNSSISSAIWCLSYPSGDLQRITNDANKYGDLSVVKDSNSLVTLQTTEYAELWVAPDADASRARRIMPGRHDGFYGFAWAPDGRIVFTREASGNSDIWIANTDGTDQKQLTTDVHQDIDPAVTNDGRYIVFESTRTGEDHIWRMDIDGSNQKQLTFAKAEWYPTSSLDSNWVVYNAFDGIWKVPVEGGTPQQISDVRCFSPWVSHDGKLIACNSGTRVMIFSFEGGQPIATLDPPKRTDGPIMGWTFDDRAIIYCQFSDGIANYWAQPIDGSQPKQLTFFKPDQLAASSRAQAALSPDGRDLLYSHYDRKSDVVMMSGLK